MSARYIPLPNENYIPTVERIMAGANATTGNKQAMSSISSALTLVDAEEFRKALADAYSECQSVYEFGLSLGVPKELARLPVPVARYSRMRASANLRNWLAFLTLRDHPHAQWEIRQYALAVGEIIAEQFPRTWELFEAGRNA